MNLTIITSHNQLGCSF